ncbi:hypothetical protein IUK39_03585 [Priestia aryabhattai]|uniref:hypothetical protein n=1 Tax=Priestia aryabhattai TaxID=412384 RepID=UPI001C0AEF8E|nr:hypothetical protein [Priestia aryabhattai]MBU3569259.1 hypothetical protein [Priestia aryabhattai]
MKIEFTFASGRTIKIEQPQNFRDFSNVNARGLLIFNDVTINMQHVESFKIID